ncbi:MAG: MarR family winged helix-turn-helix transcriptional regulator [Cyclobacteriaceae bacterium]
MKIEKAVKQESFRNVYQKATLNLLFTHSWLTDQLKSFFSEFDITPQQYNILKILKGQHPKPITTSLIRDRMLDRSSDASRLVDRLYKKELVNRTVCQKDKRLVDVTLSDKGLKLVALVDGQSEKLDGYLSQLTPIEAKEISDLLDKIRG